ncbi:hypothetical protein GCM10010191_77160 [Actinomadura vinacea]|uniref:Uncharacterized protein n=1 Tax=Actinomadura vinacea TaxID=115336 RepID=A0ABN3K3E0_9ACTN
MCGSPAETARCKVRGLCQTHADAVFGAEHPPWRRLDAGPQREIVDDWLRGLSVLAHGGHRPLEELMAR